MSATRSRSVVALLVGLLFLQTGAIWPRRPAAGGGGDDECHASALFCGHMENTGCIADGFPDGGTESACDATDEVHGNDQSGDTGIGTVRGDNIWTAPTTNGDQCLAVWLRLDTVPGTQDIYRWQDAGGVTSFNWEKSSGGNWELQMGGGSACTSSTTMAASAWVL